MERRPGYDRTTTIDTGGSGLACLATLGGGLCTAVEVFRLTMTRMVYESSLVSIDPRNKITIHFTKGNTDKYNYLCKKIRAPCYLIEPCRYILQRP